MLAHSHEKRQQAYEMWRSGSKKSVISRELGIDYDTLLIWTQRFSESGEGGLDLRYKNCGRRIDPADPVRLQAISLRQQHQDWGAEYIRLHLVREFGEEKVVQPNQIRQWLRAAGLVVKKTRLPNTSSTEWVCKPLQRVQVDAKEQLKTSDGQPCCFLNFTDEHSGAVLDAFVFPLCPHQPGTDSINL